MSQLRTMKPRYSASAFTITPSIEHIHFRPKNHFHSYSYVGNNEKFGIKYNLNQSVLIHYIAGFNCSIHCQNNGIVCQSGGCQVAWVSYQIDISIFVVPHHHTQISSHPHSCRYDSYDCQDLTPNWTLRWQKWKKKVINSAFNIVGPPCPFHPHSRQTFAH